MLEGSLRDGFEITALFVSLVLVGLSMQKAIISIDQKNTKKKIRVFLQSIFTFYAIVGIMLVLSRY